MATILDSLVGSCANKLKEIITEEVILILGIQEELAELQRKTELIHCCISDAEARRMEESTVDNWLGQLRKFYMMLMILSTWLDLREAFY